MKMAFGWSAMALMLLAGCSSLNDGKDTGEHALHHPPDRVAAPTAAGNEQQMKTMQDMHRRMAEAKTPDERAALMKDHMKAMEEGMAMMGRMRGGMMGSGQGMGDGKTPMPMDPAMMQRRMEMMEMMMQMMMDRGSMTPPVAR